MRSIAEIYQSKRWGWFDAFACFVLVAVPIWGCWRLVRRIRDAKLKDYSQIDLAEA